MKIVLTGIISGIGRYLVMEFKKVPGNHMIGIDKAPVEELPEEVSRCTDEYFQCDLSDTGKTEALILEIISKNKDLDLVIHNAGIKTFGKVTTMETGTIIDTLNVNTLTPMIFAKWLFEAFDSMVFIIIGSNSGFQAYPNTAIYGASKSAVNTLTEGIRGELKPGQRLHTICPSIIATDEFIGDHQGKTGKFRQPEDVMRAIKRILEGKEKRVIVPVIRTKWKVKYFLTGMAKMTRWFIRWD